MRWHKFISTILHPIVMPTIGILLYFIFSPINLSSQQQLTILSIVFISTYIVPLLLLVFLKAIGYIKSYQVFSIKERKVPLFFMIALLFFLAELFQKLNIVKDLSYLFYGIVLGLTITYFLFFTRLKSSLHLLSMGGAVGYFLIFQEIHGINILPIIIIFIILSGLLATSRLYLKAHTPKEVYTGFFLGFTSQFIVYFLL
ncbi:MULTISPECIES: hypothetical protein [unclassified Tenacibaculum]|uniref:hypothetical protein n=1 Tax=Tenacibaculum TaxID=104267 RepID=UPI000895015A|nr:MULTISPECIES: hypothetical protein [unclassified Tenacibaculum]RBW55263.1 hypothetical protein DS884_16680 [Tenacibaculum sp. E3R01]SEE20311.1 hypothetical protein SAMN04487765_1747 [Tenacibaculum sp. MAR_2010_89]